MRRMQTRLPGGLARALRGAPGARRARVAARGGAEALQRSARACEAAVARGLREDAQERGCREHGRLGPFAF